MELSAPIFAPLYSVDALGLPAETNKSHDPAAARARSILLETWRRNPPGQATQNRYAQAQLGYKNHVYIALNTLMDWMASAEFSIQRKAARNVQPTVKSLIRKAMGGTHAASTEWHPVEEGHEASQLFANPNATQTFGDYIALRTLCRHVYGISYEWIVKDRTGKPREMWVILPQYVYAAGWNLQYPNGYLQFNVPQPMYGMNYSGLSAFIDARDVLIHRMPNIVNPWDGYSPLTAGGQMVDVLTAVITARKAAMDNGLSIESMVKLAGAGIEEIKRVQADFDNKYTGVDRGQRVLFTNAAEIDIEPMSTTPDKMAFGESYKDSIGFVMALFGVPPALAGLTDVTSFSGLYAAVKQFTTGKLGAECKRTAEFWTKKLIEPTEGWEDLKAHLEIPSIEDDTTRPATLLSGLQANAIEVNEYRGALNMKPFDGGDCTLVEWTAKVSPAPAAMPGMEQGEEDGNGLDGSGDISGDDSFGGSGGDVLQQGGNGEMATEQGDGYPQEMMQHVLSAFGVSPDQEPAQDDGSEDDTVLEKSLTRWISKAWTRGASKSGHVTATNGVKTIYGAEAEAALAGQDKANDRPNPDLDDTFGPEKPPGTPKSGSKPDKNGYYPTEEGGYVHSSKVKEPPAPGPAEEQNVPKPPKAATPAKAVKKLADEAAANLDPATVPLAKKAIPILKRAPMPTTPVAKQSAANPQEWLPQMLKTAVPMLMGALSMQKGAASKLLIFAILAGLHHALHGTGHDETEPQEELGNDGGPVIRPGKKEIVGPRVALPKARADHMAKRDAMQRPKNAPGKGSLPGRMGKSYASWGEYFETIAQEEMVGA